MILGYFSVRWLSPALGPNRSFKLYLVALLRTERRAGWFINIFLTYPRLYVLPALQLLISLNNGSVNIVIILVRVKLTNWYTEFRASQPQYLEAIS